MKYLFAILIGVIGYHYISIPKHLVIEYYYDGKHTADVQKGLDFWSRIGLEFIPVDNIEEAYLIISHVNPERIQNPRWVAQYMPRQKTILINNKYQKILVKQNLSGVIAHETGHFLGLDHNNEKKSIMNNKSEYDTAPSYMDIQRAKKQFLSVYIKKKLDNFFN
jgi:predicted Zn-dependent protease